MGLPSPVGAGLLERLVLSVLDMEIRFALTRVSLHLGGELLFSSLSMRCSATLACDTVKLFLEAR